MKYNNILKFLIYSFLTYIFLLPLGEYFKSISYSLIIGMFFSFLNEILIILNKEK